MRVSAAGRKAISDREGVRLKAYKDTKGIPTIGVGHTTAAGEPAVKMGMRITQAECDEILARDLADVEDGLNKALKVKVTQNQYDAMASVAFNVGPNFFHSTCIKRLNANDVPGAAKAILMWNMPPEIRGRRKSEKDQFLRGYVPVSSFADLSQESQDEDPSVEDEEPEADPTDPVAKASSIDELQGHLSVINATVDKASMAAESPIVRVGMRVAQGAGGTLLAGGAATVAVAGTDDQHETFWQALNTRLDAVPGIVWLLILAAVMVATILLANYFVRERVNLQRSGRVLPKSQ